MQRVDAKWHTENYGMAHAKIRPMQIHKNSQRMNHKTSQQLYQSLACFAFSLLACLLRYSHTFSNQNCGFSCSLLLCIGTSLFHVDSPFSCFSLCRLNHHLLVFWWAFDELQGTCLLVANTVDCCLFACLCCFFFYALPSFICMPCSNSPSSLAWT